MRSFQFCYGCNDSQVSLCTINCANIIHTEVQMISINYFSTYESKKQNISFATAGTLWMFGGYRCLGVTDVWGLLMLENENLLEEKHLTYICLYVKNFTGQLTSRTCCSLFPPTHRTTAHHFLKTLAHISDLQLFIHPGHQLL